MKLRKRIEKSNTLSAVIAALVGAYLGLCQRTIRWEGAGQEELAAALAQGPVLLITWHGRLLMAPYHWPLAQGQLSSLHDTSPIARAVGALHRRLGLYPMEMSKKQSNLAASRTVLRRVKSGVSIGIAADGPTGPALEMKDAPLEWARTTGLPVFGYAFATSRGKALRTWDRMLLPLPFTRGSYVFARFPGSIPRKLHDQERAKLREDLRDFMMKTTAQVDTAQGGF